MNNVSEHITYNDAIRSDAAKRAGINNYFTPDQLARMMILAEKVYEPLVRYFKTPIYISSFFRNKKVNEIIKGAASSQHMANHGAAMDIDADMYEGITNKEIFDYIKNYLEFDQLIWEFGDKVNPAWVHVSYNTGDNRKEILQAITVDGITKYLPYGK